MQAVLHHRDVGNLRRCTHGMDQATVGIDADMRLHAEVPLMALLRLSHLGIALLVFVLGRTRRRNQRGIDDRSASSTGPFSDSTALTSAKIATARSCFQQMPEAKNGAFVRHHIFEGIQSGKLPQQRNVVQRFFHRRIGVAKPLLHEVNPQHRAQRHRHARLLFG